MNQISFRVAILVTDFEVGQQTDIGGDLVSRRTKGSKGRQHISIDLSRVGLGSDRIGILEARQFGNKSIKFLHLE